MFLCLCVGVCGSRFSILLSVNIIVVTLKSLQMGPMFYLLIPKMMVSLLKIESA